MRCRIKCVYRGWLGRCRLKSPPLIGLIKSAAVPVDCPRLVLKKRGKE